MDRGAGRPYAARMDDPQDIEDLDAEGLICPLPVLKARKRLMALTPGALLRVRATDPAARDDMPAFCKATGHELLEQSQEGPIHIFLIRRGS